MADRPILFSAPMVRALLDGRKTQTRRIINFPGVERVVDFVPVATDRQTGAKIFEMRGNAGKHLSRPAGKYIVEYHWWPRLAVGDRLWVRETLRSNDNDQGARWYGYAADGADVWPMTEWHKTRDSIPSIHMPRWASRITLLVSEVRVQRLQSISEEDAIAEGVEPYSGIDADCSGYLNYRNDSADGRWLSGYGSFCTLWDSINADRDNGWYSWANNPWVTATTFEVVKGNIDTLEQKP